MLLPGVGYMLCVTAETDVAKIAAAYYAGA